MLQLSANRLIKRRPSPPRSRVFKCSNSQTTQIHIVHHSKTKKPHRHHGRLHISPRRLCRYYRSPVRSHRKRGSCGRGEASDHWPRHRHQQRILLLVLERRPFRRDLHQRRWRLVQRQLVQLGQFCGRQGMEPGQQHQVSSSPECCYALFIPGFMPES